MEEGAKSGKRAINPSRRTCEEKTQTCSPADTHWNSRSHGGGGPPWPPKMRTAASGSFGEYDGRCGRGRARQEGSLSFTFPFATLRSPETRSVARWPGAVAMDGILNLRRPNRRLLGAGSGGGWSQHMAGGQIIVMPLARCTYQVCCEKVFVSLPLFPLRGLWRLRFSKTRGGGLALQLLVGAQSSLEMTADPVGNVQVQPINVTSCLERGGKNQAVAEGVSTSEPGTSDWEQDANFSETISFDTILIDAWRGLVPTWSSSKLEPKVFPAL